MSRPSLPSFDHWSHLVKSENCEVPCHVIFSILLLILSQVQTCPSAPFSQSSTISLRTRDQVLHLYKTRGTIFGLYILNLSVSYMRQKGKRFWLDDRKHYQVYFSPVTPVIMYGATRLMLGHRTANRNETRRLFQRGL